MLRGVGFELLDVAWKYRPLDSSPEGEQVRVGIESLEARCNNCLHVWHADPAATDQPGHFHSLVGWISITCPHCGQCETMENPHVPDH